MGFDKIISKTVGGCNIRYGIVFGNEKIVFIKAGAGGDISGYGDKYLKMAHRIRERLGATVICASNPDVEHENIDEAAIRWVAAEKKLSSYEIYFFGTSDGAYQNLKLASRLPQTVKVVGVNASFIDLSDLEEKLRALPQVKKALVYGSKDDDYQEVLPLKGARLENFELITVEGADHQFTGMLDEYIALIDLL